MSAARPVSGVGDARASNCLRRGPSAASQACVATADEPVPPVEVWMSRAQFELWSHTHLTIDVVPGRGAGFSLEAPEGVRFLIRSRLLSDDEVTALRD